MPELPEVETTVRYLRSNRASKILGARFLGVWTDFSKMIKKPGSFKEFKEKIKGKDIKKIWRRGKNIIFELSGNYFLLIHQKLTGHLLVGTWNLELGTWKPKTPGYLKEKVNSYIHLMFSLNNGEMLALSDLRKFAKVELLTKEELKKELASLGLEPLGKSFTFEKFKEVLKNKKGKIKQVLMDQKIIAGIGNIYSDEILFRAGVSPLKSITELSETRLKKIYSAILKILPLAINLKGESFADYRLPSGKRGGADRIIKVYRREGKKCLRCGAIIQKIKVGGRSAHYCPKCQR